MKFRPGAVRTAAPSAFGFACALLAASVAAVSSHLAIDLIGDFALAHDTYDRITHHSRFFALAGILFLCLAGAIAALSSALKQNRSVRTAPRTPLGPTSASACLVFVLVVVSAATFFLIAMESLDTVLASGRVFGLAANLGGSLPLGLSVTFSIAVAAALAAWRALRFIAQSQHVIASAIANWLLSRERGHAPPPKTTAALSRDCAGRGDSILALRFGKRAPPLFA